MDERKCTVVEAPELLALENRDPMVIQTKGCPRCGKDHESSFRALNNPATEWRWFAICPNTQQPVELRINDKESRDRWEVYHYGRVVSV